MTVGYGTGAPQLVFFLTQTVVSKGKSFFFLTKKKKKKLEFYPLVGVLFSKRITYIGLN